MASNVRPAPLGDIDPNDKLFGLLSYIIGVLVPIFILVSDTNKNRPFQKYHAVNSLVFSVAVIAVSVLVCLVTAILQIIPVVGQIIGLVISCISLILPLGIIGILIWYAVLAYQGNYFEIPFLTNFARQQGWLPPESGSSTQTY